MTTWPVLPPGDAPLDAETVERLLSHLGPDLVLVGGQALAFWMDRFGVTAEGIAISNDGDALGSAEQALALAQAIRAKAIMPPATARTSLVAQLRLPVGGGRERNVDVLHLLYTVDGLRKSSDFTRQVERNSVKVEWHPGRHIRVMDPFDVLESRAHNAVGLLDDKGPHVLTQASWAILVARAALLRLARDPADGERLGTVIQRIFRLARSQVGRRLWSERRIDLLDAIDVDALRLEAPTHARQLEAVRRALDTRRRAR